MTNKQAAAPPNFPYYQAYELDEDTRRTQSHYEQPAEFFYPILGGEWHSYSSGLWPEGVTTETAAQEAKLDLLARLMDLKPGQRILDVGCGWGGPLVYLCKTYGVSGVGLTVSPTQRVAIEERIAKYGVDARVIEQNWRAFDDAAGFDAIYTDEVLVHFNDLGGFFKRCYDWLHEGGRMVHKELHLTHPHWAEMDRAGNSVNEIFGLTGNYRPLAEELALANAANFEVACVYNIPIAPHYMKTMERWLTNMRDNRTALEALVEPATYHAYRRYLNVARAILVSRTMTLDVVASQKLARIVKG